MGRAGAQRGRPHHIGLHLWEIAALRPARLGLREVALPYLEDLNEAIQRTAARGAGPAGVVYVERLTGRDRCGC